MESDRQGVLMRIGAALLLVQSAERLIRMCMTLVLQRDEPLTLEKLERQKREERRKTLGYFLRELRTRADLDESFDHLLDRFLEDRNCLVHDVSEIPGWGISDPTGCNAARTFPGGFIGRTIEVQKVFAGLVRAWEEQVGFDTEFPVEHQFFAEIDARYKGRVDQVFFAKKPEEGA